MKSNNNTTTNKSTKSNSFLAKLHGTKNINSLGAVKVSARG